MQNTAFKVTDAAKTSPIPRGFTRTLADGRENTCATSELSSASCAVPKGSVSPCLRRQLGSKCYFCPKIPTSRPELAAGG